jgi:K+-sensing histidine kinase KdpD
VADVESKLRQDITPAPDAEPLFGPVASESLRYLASIAMTAAATVVAVGADSKITIPNLSLVFVVPVIVAGVSLGLGPSLCSAILGALAVNMHGLDAMLGPQVESGTPSRRCKTSTKCG